MEKAKATMRQIRVLVGSVLLLALLLPACSGSSGGSTTTEAQGLPNPASVYCGEQGGTLDIRADDAGNQYGVCVFDDGSECDEWAFYRGECAPGAEDASMGGQAGLPNPASVYCEEQGGVLDRSNADSSTGMCTFPDGSQCEEWAFYRGECAPGGADQSGIANPASVYCEEQGGVLDLGTGMCTFPDGSQCEEWAFFRGECTPGGEAAMGGQAGLPNPASAYCEEQGGTVEIRADDAGNQYGFCVFDDGSECDEWAFFRGECSIGG